MIADLYWGGCVPPWEIRNVRLDGLPWSAVSGAAFLCPSRRRRVLMHQLVASAPGATMAQAWPHLGPAAGRLPRE
jgi:hypothetical protein